MDSVRIPRTEVRSFQESSLESAMVGFTPGKWECADLVRDDGENHNLLQDDCFLMQTDSVTRRSLFIQDDSPSDLNISFSELQIINSSTKKSLKRSNTFDVRRSLFTSKRSAIEDDDTPSSKRFRDDTTTLSNATIISPPEWSSQTDIIQAVDLLTTQSDLVADGSRANTLPTVAGKHSDTKSITPQTMNSVLHGDYDDVVDKVTIIDCRYPYEFDGGHIKGAINLYTKDAIDHFLRQASAETPSGQRHVLIFHCEFSSERGPKMYRFLRAQDRELNKDHYPRLHFPEIYLLEGGYKDFFTQCKNQCYPMTYKPMLHKDHAADLRHFRVKSKSWAAGQKQMRRDNRTRLSF